jgi:hypothetical protein
MKKEIEYNVDVRAFAARAFGTATLPPFARCARVSQQCIQHCEPLAFGQFANIEIALLFVKHRALCINGEYALRRLSLSAASLSAEPRSPSVLRAPTATVPSPTGSDILLERGRVDALAQDVKFDHENGAPK